MSTTMSAVTVDVLLTHFNLNILNLMNVVAPEGFKRSLSKQRAHWRNTMRVKAPWRNTMRVKALKGESMRVENLQINYNLF